MDSEADSGDASLEEDPSREIQADDDPQGVVDLAGDAGEQTAASSGPSLKRKGRGRPSQCDAHVLWDGDSGDRKPGKCIYCKAHHYKSVRIDAVRQHLLKCPALPEAAAKQLMQSLAKPAEPARPKRVKLAFSSTSQSGRGSLDSYVHHRFGKDTLVKLAFALLRWLVVANVSWQAVDSPFFKDWMELLSPQWKFPREVCC